MNAMHATTTRAAAAGAVVACALVLAGCTNSVNSSSATGKTTSQAPSSGAAAAASASGGGSYSDGAAVISALNSAGHGCTPVADTSSTNVKAPGLRSAAACSVGSSGGTVTATVFDDHTDAEAYAQLLTYSQNSGLLLGSTSARAVLGRNWVVLVPDDTAYANQVSSALGGSVVQDNSK